MSPTARLNSERAGRARVDAKSSHLREGVSGLKTDETTYQVILENISDTLIVTDDHGNMLKFKRETADFEY